VNARQADDDLNLGMDIRHSSFQGIELALKTSYHYNLQKYRDPNPFFPIDAAYRNGLMSLNPELHWTIGSAGRILTGVEWNEGSLRGNDFGSVIRRTQRSLYLSNEWRLVYDRPMWDLISLYGMLRYDAISDVGDVLMPKVGVNVRVSRKGDVRLRASYGRSFRSPSFNDLYYIGFSNPNLRPEYSTGADVGIVAEMRDAQVVHRFGITYFDIRTRDRILFDLSTFLPMNIGKVTSSGVEATYAGILLDGHLTLELNYSVVKAIKRNQESASDPAFGKQLMFIPERSGNMIATFIFEPVRISIAHAAVGKRFTTNDHSSALPEHHLTDLRVAAAINLGNAIVTVGGELRNVFNRSYEVFPDYPMPGRVLRIGAGIEY
jgi:outer membrane cobalamin receptor